MNKRIFRILLILLCIPVVSTNAQWSRLNALGGLSFSIIDIDSKLDPFAFGGNPAWLTISETQQRLEISPSVNNDWGGYRRYFDPEGTLKYSAGFVGVKPLGKSGTFRGSAVYDYQIRRMKSRSLTSDPYSGDAFFFTDSTSGNFRYRGPTFEFMHSLMLFENFYVGASIDYQIYDGLKSIYTYAQSMYRNVSGKIGVVYRVSDKLNFGLDFSLDDSQERIEASDVNLLTVRTFLYRGDTYNIELRGSSQDYKLKKDGKAFGFQTFWRPVEDVEVGLKAEHYSHRSKVLFPQNGLIDDEDGYSSYGITDVQLRARWQYDPNLTFGITGGYYYDDSWSKNSKRELLIWQWNITDFHMGAGFSASLIPSKLLVGAEYEVHSISADSNKYIDNSFSNRDGLNHLLRIGCEYSLLPGIALRAGYNFVLNDHDFIIGGDNVYSHYITAGCGIKFSDLIETDIHLNYSTTNLTDKEIFRRGFGAFLTLRFFNF